MEQRFTDQVVVITGAATGIGSATARRFAAEGASVACLDVNESANFRTVAAARAAGATRWPWHATSATENNRFQLSQL